MTYIHRIEGGVTQIGVAFSTSKKRTVAEHPTITENLG
jgi:hypothetical protein